MSILEKLNKAIKEKDGNAASELIHDDYKRYSHLQGGYTDSGKQGMIDAINQGKLNPVSYTHLTLPTT